MITLASLAVLVVGATQGSTARPMATVGAYKIDGRDVPATVSSSPGPISASDSVLTFEGSKYLIGAQGNFVRRFRADGGWSEVRSEMARPLPSPAPMPWRVKVFLLSRSNLVDVAPNGLARFRNSHMEASEIAHVHEAIARFAAMAESASQRRLTIRIDLETDLDPVPQIAERGKPPFGPEFLNDYLTPRLNGGLYEAEDKIYRGPYDSVFVIHAGFSLPTPDTIVQNTAVTPIGFYTQGRPLGPDALSISLFNGWVNHLEFAAKKAGYSFGSGVDSLSVPTPGEFAQGFGPLREPNAVFKGSMWTKVNGSAATPTETYLARRSPIDIAPRPWAEVADDPFAKLPFLTTERLASLAGATGLSVLPGWRTTFLVQGVPAVDPTHPFAPDQHLSVGHEAVVRLETSSPARSLLLVDALYAELFGAGIASEYRPLAAGWVELAGRRFLVLQVENLPRNVPEASLISLPGNPWQGRVPAVSIQPANGLPPVVDLIPDGSTAAKVPVSGGFTVSNQNDPERGNVIAIQVGGLVRIGSALLLGHRGGPTLFSPGDRQYLSFFVKTTNAEPMNLRFAHTGGAPDHILRIFGRWPAPSEAESDSKKEVILPPGDGWKHVVIDLRAHDISVVSALWLEASEYVGCWPSPQFTPPTILVDDVKVSETAPGPVSEVGTISATVPNATASDPVARALFAAGSPLDTEESRTAVSALLKDPADDVRLNAVRAFIRTKSPGVEPALGEVLTSLNPILAASAADALGFQASEAAHAILKRAVEIGPFDFTRVNAARALAHWKEPKLTATFSLMLTSPSWRGRANAATALGAMPGDSSQLVLMAFLHEVDPAVRLAVTKAANVGNEEVCKRLLWSAVNDPLDELRAMSSYRLIQSGKANYVTEALKGIRDDSVGMRRRLLELLRANPIEGARPALRLAVADTSPEIRAEALRTFAAWPGAVRREEVENAFRDQDPRVIAALSELRQAKGL